MKLTKEDAQGMVAYLKDPPKSFAYFYLCLVLDEVCSNLDNNAAKMVDFAEWASDAGHIFKWDPGVGATGFEFTDTLIRRFKLSPDVNARPFSNIIGARDARIHLLELYLEHLENTNAEPEVPGTSQLRSDDLAVPNPSAELGRAAA